MNQAFHHVNDSSLQKVKGIIQPFLLNTFRLQLRTMGICNKENNYTIILLNILNLSEVKFKVSLRCWFECDTSDNNSLK